MREIDKKLAEHDWSDDPQQDLTDEQAADLLRQIDWARTQAAIAPYDMLPRWWPAFDTTPGVNNE